MIEGASGNQAGQTAEAELSAKYKTKMWLPSLRVGEYRLESIDKLQTILEKGKSAVNQEGVHASIDGYYQRPFGRDTYFTLQGLLYAAQDFGSDLVDKNVLISAAASYLQYIALDDDPDKEIFQGELPHEVALQGEKLPDWLPLDESGAKSYSSSDATGLAILTIEQILAEFPGNEELEKRFNPFLWRMGKWSIGIIKRYGGMVGYVGYRSGEDPYQKVGGLDHTWQDGKYSILDNKGRIPKHPMHPVLEQGLYWKALNLIADRFEKEDPDYSRESREAARTLQKNFNEKFFYIDGMDRPALARAVDGNGQRIRFENVDQLVGLSYVYKGKTILNEENEKYLPELVRRLIENLYTPFGLRNQMLGSPVRQGMVYHRASSIWPFINGVVVRGIAKELKEILDPAVRREFHTYALDIAKAVAGSIIYFGDPIETLQVKNQGLELYRETRLSGENFESSRIQAWTVGWGEWIYGFLKSEEVTEVPVPVFE